LDHHQDESTEIIAWGRRCASLIAAQNMPGEVRDARGKTTWNLVSRGISRTHQENVVGGDPAMNDVYIVGAFESEADLAREAQDLVWGERATGDSGRKVNASEMIQDHQEAS